MLSINRYYLLSMRNLNDRFCGGKGGSGRHDGMFIGLGLTVCFKWKKGGRVGRELVMEVFEKGYLL